MTTLRQRITQVIADPFPEAPLSSRERQVIRLASRGLPVISIRMALDLQERTTYNTLEAGLEVLRAHLGLPRLSRHDLPGLVLDKIEALVGSQAGTDAEA